MFSNRTALPFAVLFVTLSSARIIHASELKAHTAQAFQHYVELTEARMLTEIATPGQFLYIDTLPEEERNRDIERIKAGQVYIRQMTTKEGDKKIEIHDGLAHHWLAIGFLPKAHLAGAIRIAQDYDHHADYFAPDIQRSHLVSQDGEHFHAYFRLYRHTIVTVTYNTEFEAEYTLSSPTQAYCFSKATRIAEVHNPGDKNEHEYPVGNDHGFLWRLNLYTRYVEVDDGLFIQVEFLSLSRTVPALFAWFVNPYLRSIPRDYLTDYIRRFGKAVNHLSEERLPATSAPAQPQP